MRGEAAQRWGSCCRRSRLAEGWSERACRVAAPHPAASVCGSICCKVTGHSVPLPPLLRPTLPLPSPPALFSSSLFSAARGSASDSGRLLRRVGKRRSSTPGFPLASVLLLCLPRKRPSPSALFHPPRAALSQQLVLAITMLRDSRGGTSSPRGDHSLRDAPGVTQILQRPLMDLGHLPGGAGAPLGDTAATCFAV